MADSSKDKKKVYNTLQALNYILESENEVSDTEICMSSSEDEQEEDIIDFCDRGADIVSGNQSEVSVSVNVSFYFSYDMLIQ